MIYCFGEGPRFLGLFFAAFYIKLLLGPSIPGINQAFPQIIFAAVLCHFSSRPGPPPPTEQTRVLEIGFGCGYSADRIQELRPRSHTVVEPDPVVLERLRAWAEIRPGVTIVEGFWQTALPALGRFDAIFFDDFPVSRVGLLYYITAGEIAPPYFLRHKIHPHTHKRTYLPPQ